MILLIIGETRPAVVSEAAIMKLRHSAWISGIGIGVSPSRGFAFSKLLVFGKYHRAFQNGVKLTRQVYRHDV